VNVKKNSVISILIVWCGLFLLACTKITTTENLVCQLSVKNKQACSSVLSLESGTLRLDNKNNQFVLEAHYAACFQATDTRVTGIFKQQLHQSIIDLELLAQKTVNKKGVIDDFSRTIGRITLNNTALTGRFIDIWAMIRTHTQTVENLPYVEVMCRKKKNIKEK
jgi:hypothetical protein